MSNNKEVWCTLCGKRLPEKEVENISKCPSCGSDGVPCFSDNDFLFEINWHELHLLCVWAEQWSIHIEHKEPIVYAIARRLQNQVPGKHSLTLAGEIYEIKTDPKFSNIETNIKKFPPVPAYGPGAVGYSKKRGKNEV